jgi:DNA-binding NarL/FixJ family response regulator
MNVADPQISVVIADDHPVVLRGIVGILGAEPDLHIVAVCSDGIAAELAIKKHLPDVAVLDVAMGDSSGIDLLSKLRVEGELSTRFIFLTATGTPDQLLNAIELGASGILLKETATTDLVDCIRAVANGNQWLPQDLIAVAHERQTSRAVMASRFATLLTRRERELMLLVAQSLSNKEIARELGLAEGTIKIHLHNIYQKVGVNNRTALATLTLAHQEELSRLTSKGGTD